MSWLHSELEREDALDALESLHGLAASDDPVTDEVLRDLIEELNRGT